MQSSDDIPGETPAAPAALVAEILASLRKAEGTDVGLLDILEKRIVTMNSGDTAVADALKDIERLASKRGGSPGNGQADHD
jgi:hypothetical protein